MPYCWLVTNTVLVPRPLLELPPAAAAGSGVPRTRTPPSSRAPGARTERRAMVDLLRRPLESALGPSVAVMDQAGFRPAALQGHDQRVHAQPGPQSPSPLAARSRA